MINYREYLIGLFNYNGWANEKALESILNAGSVDEQAIKLFSHILASQRIWLNRIKKARHNIFPWEEVFSRSQLLFISKDVNDKWMKLIESSSEEDLSREIVYKTRKGDEYKNTVRDIIIHVMNHSTYHRGQIAAVVRASGGTPSVTDYIAYKRTGGSE